MKLKHNGTTYECAVAVKCEDDCYIKLYDEAGNEIASFFGISDFGDYEIIEGEFTSPCDCGLGLQLALYSIGGRTITAADWILNEESGMYEHFIESNLISSNTSTCNVLLLFKQGTELDYTSKQESGRVILATSSAPVDDIVIESIRVERVAK